MTPRHTPNQFTSRRLAQAVLGSKRALADSANRVSAPYFSHLIIGEFRARACVDTLFVRAAHRGRSIARDQPLSFRFQDSCAASTVGSADGATEPTGTARGDKELNLTHGADPVISARDVHCCVRLDMAIRTQQTETFRVRANFLDSSAATAGPGVLFRVVNVVKVEGAQTSVIPAHLTSAAELRNQRVANRGILGSHQKPTFLVSRLRLRQQRGGILCPSLYQNALAMTSDLPHCAAV